MAEKHKSKYKKPENTKYKSRKDLKDYTMDDKDGGMNPKSTKDKQLNVLRKTDKEMVDTGDMFIKYNAEDRLYKDLEKADWEPKDAAKKMKKRQDAEEKEVKDVLADKIENLTREQKERLVREYVRRKIAKILVEQPTPTDEPPVEEEPPTVDPAAATTTPDATAVTTPDPAAPTPTDPAAATVPDASMDMGTDMSTPATAPAPKPAPTAEAVPTLDSAKFKELGNIKRIGMLRDFFSKIIANADLDEKQSFYHRLRKLAASEYIQLKQQSEKESRDQNL
jgi:hypothetical protein